VGNHDKQKAGYANAGPYRILEQASNYAFTNWIFWRLKVMLDRAVYQTSPIFHIKVHPVVNASHLRRTATDPQAVPR